ncbi:MAG TPA: hypothetical protein VFD90_17360 [Gaiellales bacterium]|jgi:hypothetical protein|nr:hypothetical protein [Gaiellales bacterium]
MSIAVEDWDELSGARRRRGEQAASAAPAKEPAEDGSAPVGVTAAVVAAETVEDDDSLEAYGENLRPVLSVAGANLFIWAVGHLTGVVELIGVSFFASVGLLLASYVLREWHRDRGALVCLAGALPLPVTIFSLLT